MPEGQFQSRGANDWVERMRDFLDREPPALDEAVLEAAYEAGEIDTEAMFAYCEGRLSEEDRREVEAEAAASPHALRKLARIGAILARSQAGLKPALARSAARVMRSRAPARPSFTPAASAPEAASTSESRRVVHRVKLGPPRPSSGLNAPPRPEDSVRVPTDPAYELSRSLEKNRDQLRIYHESAPVGTLLGVKFSAPATEADSAPTKFVVLRRGSESTTAAALTIPSHFQEGEVNLELWEIPFAELTAEEACGILKSYEHAAQEDPIAVTPLHEPRSAWQTWADAVLNMPAERVHPALWEVAELIAIA